jgi:hypothetical protein
MNTFIIPPTTVARSIREPNRAIKKPALLSNATARADHSTAGSLDAQAGYPANRSTQIPERQYSSRKKPPILRALFFDATCRQPSDHELLAQQENKRNRHAARTANAENLPKFLLLKQERIGPHRQRQLSLDWRTTDARYSDM